MKTAQTNYFQRAAETAARRETEYITRTEGQYQNLSFVCGGNLSKGCRNVSQNVPGSGLFFFDLLERVERYSETLPAMCLAVSRLRLQPGLIRRHPNSLEIRSLTAFYRNIRNRNRPQIFTCEIHLSLIGFTFPDISRPIGRGYFLS